MLCVCRYLTTVPQEKEKKMQQQSLLGKTTQQLSASVANIQFEV